MEVGQELSIQEVKALLAGKLFRRQGIGSSPSDSINDAQRNFKSGASVDSLIGTDFLGDIHFNPVIKDKVVLSDKISSFRITSYPPPPPKEGKFYYHGQIGGY